MCNTIRPFAFAKITLLDETAKDFRVFLRMEYEHKECGLRSPHSYNRVPTGRQHVAYFILTFLSFVTTTPL